eukprot:Seg815.2 transcript_id=Seg815.2/GoldUCD/mRNA.D3Y31 product="Voltage-dependent L-type calcium channel subunit alpha-1S" protein_id=Seg815.2/GoldUCD/D3Y31
MSTFKNCFAKKKETKLNMSEVKMEDIVVVAKSKIHKKKFDVDNQKAGSSIECEQHNEEPPKRTIGSRLKNFLAIVANSDIFFFVVMGVIIVNMGCLAASGTYYLSIYDDQAEMLNFACAGIYNIELAINVAGLGLYHYFENKFQFIDLCSVIILNTDLAYNVAIGQNSSGLTALKCLSLMRLIKRTRLGSYLDKMETSFVRSVKSIFSLLLVLLLVLVIYALLGNHLFKKYPTPLDQRVGSFKTAKDSMLLVFVLLTGEGWPNIMSSVVKAYGQDHKKGTILVPLAYFLSFILFANFILLNIFLGIMIDNLTAEAGVTFAGKNKPKKRPILETSLNKNTRKQECKEMYQTPLNIIVETDESATSDENETNKSRGRQDSKKIAGKGRQQNKKTIDSEADRAGKRRNTGTNASRNKSSNKNLKNGKTARSLQIPKQRDEMLAGRRRRLSGVERSMSIRPEFIEKGPQHKSLFIFGPNNPVRAICYKIATNKWFQYICLGSIIISTIILALEDPLNRNTTLAKTVLYSDYLFTGIFMVEIIIKIIAFGLVLGDPSCYLREKFNAIDLIVTLISLVYLSIRAAGVAIPVSLNVLRVLRVLRTIRISAGLRYVVRCLVGSLIKIFGFFLVYVIVLFIYAVIVN